MNTGNTGWRLVIAGYGTVEVPADGHLRFHHNPADFAAGHDEQCWYYCTAFESERGDVGAMYRHLLVVVGELAEHGWRVTEIRAPGEATTEETLAK